MTMLEAIVDYKMDEDTVVSREDQCVITQYGQHQLQKTTVSWKLFIRWKDGSEVGIKQKDLMESNLVELAKFAEARGIDKEPAFAWWVPYTLLKCDVIHATVKRQIQK